MNPFPNKPCFLCVCSTCLLKTLCEKGEITRKEQFLLFPHWLLPSLRTFCHFDQIQNCCLQTLLVWKSQKYTFGKGLIVSVSLLHDNIPRYILFLQHFIPYYKIFWHVDFFSFILVHVNSDY